MMKGSAKSASNTWRAKRPFALMSALCANQLPVRIARRDIAGERPDAPATSVTFPGLPSTVAPALSRGTATICDKKRHRELRGAITHLGDDQFRLVDADKPRLDLLFALLAFANRAAEAFINFLGEQILQRATIAAGGTRARSSLVRAL